MSPRPPQGSISSNQHAYIPAGAQQALARQMQQSVPAHLQKYTGPNAGYVPPRAQQELTSYMEAALPQHLQQYAGAYVEQNIVTPSMSARPGAQPAATFRPNKPINPRNLSHSSLVGNSQADANQLLNQFQETAGQRTGAAPVAAPAPPPTQYPPAPANPNNGYDFILNPTAPAKAPGSGSFGKRLAVICGAGGVLLIAIILVASLLGKSGTQTGVVTVAQEQTELLRIAALAQQQSNTPSIQQLANATTINLLSAQNQTLAYLAKNKQKVSANVLGLKHSASTDTTLNNAVATSNFDTVFPKVMQQQLTEYSSVLQTAYKANSGPNGKVLLKQQYAGAQLLLQEATQ